MAVDPQTANLTRRPSRPGTLERDLLRMADRAGGLSDRAIPGRREQVAMGRCREKGWATLVGGTWFLTDAGRVRTI